MQHSQTTAETVGTAAAKVAAPASVSLATVFGVQVSELVLWATLIYTVLMIGHKLIAIARDLRE